MSQTLQNQLLLSKSMNGIISFDDGAGTTISNGQVVSNTVNTSTFTTNSLSAIDMSLNNIDVSVRAGVPTVSTGDNSTNAASTAFVKNQNYTTLAAVQSNNNTWTGSNFFSTLPTFSGNRDLYYSDVGNNIIGLGSGISTAGVNNIYIGTQSGTGNVGNYNVCLGFQTLSAGGNLQGHSCFGYRAGADFVSGTINNTCIGLFAGLGATNGDSENMYIGNGAGSDGLARYDNSIAIGRYSKIFASNVLVLGGTDGFYGYPVCYLMGGGVIPSGKDLNVIGNFKSNGTTVSNTQFGYVAALTSGIVELSGNQTVAGIKTFSSPPVMSGASITSGTVGQTQVTDGYLNLTGASTQTVTTRKEFTTGGLVMRNPYPLVGNMNTPANLSTILCVSIGNSNLAACPSTAGQTAITAIGGGVLQALTSAGAGLVGIGNGALGQATALGNFNTAIGYRAGYNQTTGASVNCSFLGAETTVSVATTAYTKSTCVGHGSNISRSNEVTLGTSTETVYVPGTLQVQNNYVNGASPTLITTTITITLSGVLYEFYSVTSAAAYSITLPAAAVGYLGCKVTFRRVNTTITNAVTSASANIYPLNSVTAGTTLLAASVCQVTIVCMLLSATPTYGWFVIA